MLFILGKCVATFYALTPFVAVFIMLFDPPLALGIFIVWIISAGTMAGIAFAMLALKAIWSNE